MKTIIKATLILLFSLSMLAPAWTPAAAASANPAASITFSPNVPIGSFTNCTFGSGLANDCLGKYVAAWYGFALGIIGILATFMITYAGFKYLTSRGDSKAISDAKDIMISGISGVVIAFLSYTILNLVNPRLLTINMPELAPIEMEHDDSGIAPEKVRPASSGGTSSGVGSGSDLSLWTGDQRTAVEKIKQINGVNNVTTYEGHAGGIGQSADVWCPNNDCTAVAETLASRYQELNISYLIWNQRIWNPNSHGQGSRQNAPQNPSGDPSNMPASTWDLMQDRGSNTQNHRDHIHITFK